MACFRVGDVRAGTQLSGSTWAERKLLQTALAEETTLLSDDISVSEKKLH